MSSPSLGRGADQGCRDAAAAAARAAAAEAAAAEAAAAEGGGEEGAPPAEGEEGAAAAAEGEAPATAAAPEVMVPEAEISDAELEPLDADALTSCVNAALGRDAPQPRGAIVVLPELLSRLAEPQGDLRRRRRRTQGRRPLRGRVRSR